MAFAHFFQAGLQFSHGNAKWIALCQFIQKSWWQFTIFWNYQTHHSYQYQVRQPNTNYVTSNVEYTLIYTKGFFLE